MKQSHHSLASGDELECAGLILEMAPLIMSMARRRRLNRMSKGCSFSQFRILEHLHRRPQSNLSSLADHLGLMRPTISKTIDGLVERGWVTRVSDSMDRRYVRLDLTAEGAARYDAAEREIRTSLAQRLQALHAEEQKTVLDGMRMLQKAFAKGAASGKPAQGSPIGQKRKNGPQRSQS